MVCAGIYTVNFILLLLSWYKCRSLKAEHRGYQRRSCDEGTSGNRRRDQMLQLPTLSRGSNDFKKNI